MSCTLQTFVYLQYICKVEKNGSCSHVQIITIKCKDARSIQTLSAVRVCFSLSYQGVCPSRSLVAKQIAKCPVSSKPSGHDTDLRMKKQWDLSNHLSAQRRLPRLILVLAGRTDHFAGFVVRRLSYNLYIHLQCLSQKGMLKTCQLRISPFFLYNFYSFVQKAYYSSLTTSNCDKTW